MTSFRSIDNEIEFGRLLNRNVGRLGAAQNLVDESGGAPRWWKFVP